MIRLASSGAFAAREVPGALARFDAVARRIEAGSPEFALADLVMDLAKLRAGLPPPGWRQFCRAARATVLAERLARDPIVSAALRRPLRDTGHDDLLDLVAGTPNAAIGSEGRALHTAIANRPLTAAIRERDGLLRSRASDHARLSIQPRIVAITAAGLRGSAPMDDPADDQHADFSFVRGMFDCLGMAEAMRVTRSASSNLRSGGCFLFSSFAHTSEDAAFVECFLDWWPAWRTESEMHAIAAAAGRGFAKRHWTTSNGAMHFCEVLRP